MATNNFSASVSLNTGQSNKNIRTLSGNVSNLSTALTELDKAIKNTNGSLDSIAQSVNTSSDAMRQATQASKEFARQKESEATASDQVVKSEKDRAGAYTETSKASGAAADAAARVGAESAQAAQGARDHGAAQKEVEGAVRGAKDGTDAYSESLASHRYLMYDVGDTYRTVAAAMFAIPAATSAVAIAFEKDFAQVQRTTGLAGDAAFEYNRQLKQLSTEIPSTFSELAEVSKIGGQMAVAEESLADFTDTVVRFTETADGVNVDKAATAFGRLENMFNVTPTGELADPEFFRRIGSAISYTADNSVTTEEAIISMLEKTTASAKNAGLEIQETIALSSAMASSGLQPFLSSGFIIRFFGNFQKAAAEGGRAVEDLAGSLGFTAEEFQNLVRNDPYAILHRVVSMMKDMDSVESKQFLQRLGINGVQDPKVLNALSENLHVLDQAMTDVNESYASADYLDKSSEGIFNTTAANIQKLINAFLNLGDTIGKSSLPGFSHLLQAATGLVSGLDDLISRSKLAQGALGVLMGLLTYWGGVAAFRSSLSFVNAALVMFRDAAQKGALAGGRFGGITRQLAEIMLYNKGANDQLVQAMLKGRSTSEAFRMAFAAKRTEVQKATAALQANTGAASANATAQSRAAGATSAQAAAAAASVGSTGKHAAELSRAGRMGQQFSTVLGGIRSLFGGLLNPAFLATTAVIGLGAAWMNSNAQAKAFSEGMGESIAAIGNFEGSVDAAIEKLKEFEYSFTDAVLGNRVGIHDIGKDFLEIAEQAGVSGDRLREAFEGGTDSLTTFKRELEDVLDRINSGELTGDGIIDQRESLITVINQVEDFIEEAEKAEEANRRLAEAGVEVAGSMDEVDASTEGATESMQSFGQSAQEAIDTVFGFINAEAGVTTALENMGKSLHESSDMSTATSEGIANIENYQRVVSSALGLLEQQLKDGTFSTVQEATAYYEQFFAGLEQQLINTGVDPAQAQQMTQMALEAMQMTLGAEGNELTANLDVDPTGAYEVTDQTLANISEVINSGAFEIILDANGQPATANTWAVVNWIAEVMGITPEAVLDAIDGTATENTSAVWEYILAVMHDDFTAQLNADGTPGMNNVANFYNWTMDRLDEITEGINIAGTDLNNLISAYNNAPVPGMGAGGMIAFSGARPASRGRVSTIMSPAQAAARRARNAPQAPTLAKSAPTMPSIPQPDFSALNRGYNNAAKAARGAGKAAQDAGKAARNAGNAGRKAGNSGAKGANAARKATDRAREAAEKAAQAARDWNKSWQDLQSWASRVGEALTMAFDKKHAVQAAKDEYYSVLNGINERLKQQKDRVKELREETKRLTAERRVELNEASKFERMAEIAAHHGNDERAKDYRDQAKAMRERANEMSSQISANKAEQASIQAGIGTLKGYSQAAIDNRKELRQLEQAAMKVPQAYASIGASASTVAKQTRQWSANLRTHSRELNYTRNQIANNTQSTAGYIRELNRVPRSIPTVVSATHRGVPGVNRALNNVSQPRTSVITPRTGNTSPASRRLNSVASPRTAPINAAANTGRARGALDNAAQNRTVMITAQLNRSLNSVILRLDRAAKQRNSSIRARAYGVSTVLSQLNRAARTRTALIRVRTVGGPLFNTGGFLRFNQGGQVPAYNSGGLIPGKSPANPREDNLIANVDGKGHVMVRSNEYIQPEPAVKYYGLDFMEKVRQMKLPKYYAGGSLGGSRQSNPVVDGPVDLSAKSINQLAQAISTTTILEVSREELARTTSNGQTVNNQKRGIFRVE